MSQFHADQPEIPRLPEQPVSQSPAPMHSRRQLPRYKLVLLADSQNDLMHVVRSVMELTRFPRAEATHKMWEAHHRGRSVLLLTYRERGELYVEQFVSRGLHVTIEPAWS
jgi:ATP-dependent Clp protease adapter protein ClpS